MKLFVRIPIWVSILTCFMVIAGCATAPPKDRSAILQNKPKSILILPPTNNTVEVNATYTFLSVITKPLAEKGYYVFPVAVVDQFLKENGLPTPDEMNAISLDKISQHIGADAVLYVNISDWGQKYRVLSSETVVQAQMRLIDVRTGQLLWDGNIRASQGSNDNNNGGGLLGAVVGAVIAQVAGSLSDNTPELARNAATFEIYDRHRGLPDGYRRDILKAQGGR